ncbi:hypothetical protein GCM10007989_15480 [Devosia pacifica]|uniref:N-acetyltransferase domain-containing protein n=1 Tax=Devosia pacifica TaxID=1335967 RepID=A0A918S2W7_9HYPH|nr:GNAT family N-acetyltransferase [Devosia pacifica]GHA21178.1 hypothetical protein GCM10007989_15480 [Devosia pacifica]
MDVRQATENDRQALFDICLRTADSGADASALYWDKEYPGLVWAVPYLEFEPGCALVLAEEDRVLGYVVGTPDTQAFAQKLEEHWWPVQRRRLAGRQAVRKKDQSVLDIVASPSMPPEEIVADYPAHLHINLLPKAQGKGNGRMLIEAELEALRQAGAEQVHLGVSPSNDRAKAFYARLGFERLSKDDETWMGRAL